MRALPLVGGRPSLRAALGFACNQGFVFSLFYMGANRSLDAASFSFERADLFGTLLFMIAAFALIRVASVKARGALLAQPLVWCYAGLLVVGSLVPVFMGNSTPGTLLFESAIVGLPAGFMLAAWGRTLGSRPMVRSVPEVFVGSALGALVCLIFATLPVAFAPLVLKLLPLGSAWALRTLFCSADATESRVTVPAEAPLEEAVQLTTSPLSLRALLASPSERAETARLSLKMTAGTVLFGLASGFMETYGSDPGMASTPALPATLLLFVLFCVAALQLLASGKLDGASPTLETTVASRSGEKSDVEEPEGPLDGTYRLAILVMMAGFLFVPVLGDFGVPGEAIVLAGYLGLSAVLVSLFLVRARITGQDAALSFSRGFAALFAGEMAGIGLGNVIEALAGGGQTPYAIVACAGLAALYAYLFLFTERDFRALSIIARDADRFDDACHLIVSERGLSKREAEILPFALKGRTGERIAAEFYISKSTVDTHLRRMYAKCEVHGRQELIDLGERTMRGLDHR